MLHPKLARDVKSMIGELGTITVFWDEQWLSTLQDLRAGLVLSCKLSLKFGGFARNFIALDEFNRLG